MKTKAYIRLLRISQWTKNVFVLLPMFFGGKIGDPGIYIHSLFAFLAFCFCASGIYCLNDIVDMEADRLHPAKRQRPVASGDVSKKGAYICMAVCLMLSFSLTALAFHDSTESMIYVMGVLAVYIVMNVAYSLWLKHISVIDVFVIATGFVLRVVTGGLATGVILSHWIVLMTFLLALFLAFAKRRNDYFLQESGGPDIRKSLKGYSSQFLDQMTVMTAGMTIVCYILYTVSPDVTSRFHNNHVYLTTVFVVAGIVRYLQLTMVLNKSGSPTQVLLKDRFTHIVVLGWILSFAVIIYAS